MDENREHGSDKERTVNFALLVQKTVDSPTSGRIHIQSKNEGIPDGELLLIVEAWLDKMKKGYKENLTKDMFFGSQPPKK